MSLEDYFNERDKNLEKRISELLKQLLEAKSGKIEDPKKWVRTHEAMKLLDCSKSQLQRYKVKERVVWRKVGNTLYFLRESLIKLIENA